MTGIMQMVANNVAPAVSALIQLLYLDPGNGSSYSGSGTTWTDLSGNNNTATLVGSPTWTNAGIASYFSFNGTGSQYATTVPAKYAQTYTGKTVIVAIRPSASAWTSGLDQFRGIFGTAAGSRNFNTYIHQDSSNNLQIHYSAGGAGGFSNNISLPSTQWSIVAVTQTTGGLVTYYLNGQAVGTNTGVTFAQYVNSGNTENVARTDNYWLGDIGVTAVYGSALTASQIQSNYTTLAAQYAVVSNGLQLYLDADNPTSYPGTGTTWFDLSGQGNDVVMQNSGSISYTASGGGYFTLASNGYFNRATTTGIPTGTSAYTMSVWVQWPTGTWPVSGGMIGIGSSITTNQTNQFRTVNTNGLVNYWYGNDLGATSTVSPASQWVNIVAQWDGTTRKIWVNGTQIASAGATGLNVTSSLLQVGATNVGGSEPLQGNIGQALIYNRALTSTEIQQNYTAIRGRYGV
jgi:hypothetical protein